MSSFDLARIAIDRTAEPPLYRQITDQLRHAIMTGALPGGTPLPPTRTLATTLGVSRITIVAAYEQLVAEGYLHSQVGVGTRVANDMHAREPHAPPVPTTPSLPRSRPLGSTCVRTH